MKCQHALVFRQLKELPPLFSLKHDFLTEWHRFNTGTNNFVATVKRDHFPYFTQGKQITIGGLQIHAIQDYKLGSVTLQGLNLAAFTETLKDEGAFELSLAPEGAVLVRDKEGTSSFLSSTPRGRHDVQAESKQQTPRRTLSTLEPRQVGNRKVDGRPLARVGLGQRRLNPRPPARPVGQA
jgi:hypothetical protein